MLLALALALGCRMPVPRALDARTAEHRDDPRACPVSSLAPRPHHLGGRQSLGRRAADTSGDDLREPRRFDRRVRGRITRDASDVGAYLPRSKRGRFGRSLPLKGMVESRERPGDGNPSRAAHQPRSTPMGPMRRPTELWTLVHRSWDALRSPFRLFRLLRLFRLSASLLLCKLPP
jgi:hypothetical protein